MCSWVSEFINEYVDILESGKKPAIYSQYRKEAIFHEVLLLRGVSMADKICLYMSYLCR